MKVKPHRVKAMPPEVVREAKALEARLNHILDTEGFTAEADSICDRISYYCITHGISAETYVFQTRT